MEKIIEMMPFWAVVIICIMFVAMKFYYTRFKKLEDKTSHADCQNKNGKIDTIVRDMDSLKRDVDGLKKDVDGLKETMQSNNGMLVELSRWAMHIDEGMIGKLAQKYSPLRMTEAGEYLYRVSGAKDAVCKISQRLIGELEAMHLRTEFDVEDKSLDLIIKNSSDEAFDPIKKFVYYSPDTIHIEGAVEDVKFNMLSLMKLMSIDLRDRFLSKHPEVAMKQIGQFGSGEM